jgi:hypothetical protein
MIWWMDECTVVWRDNATDIQVIRFISHVIIPLHLQSLIRIYFSYRLAQLRDSGVQFRIRQQYITPKKHNTEPSSIFVSLVTVAPIWVLLTAGNLLGLILLMMEKCVHAYIFKTWSVRFIRWPHNKEYRLSGHDHPLVELHFIWQAIWYYSLKNI